MTNKERFLRTLSFKDVDRIPLMDFGYWGETIKTWHNQGLPKTIQCDEQVEQYLGLDKGFELGMLNGVRHWDEKAAIFRLYPKFVKKIVEENDNFVVYVNGEGVTLQENKLAVSMPHFLDYPVKNMSDFERIADRLNANDPGRLRDNFEDIILKAATTDEPVGLWIDGFYGWPRELMGFETLVYAFYDEPELIKAINRQHTEFIKQYVKIFTSRIKIDYVCFFEDMAYNNGAFISPELFQEFIQPYYVEIMAYLRESNIEKIVFDSDGNTVELARLFVELGFDGHYPLEIASGSHPEILRERYPNLALIGGIDKRALIAGRDAIDKELSKLPPLLDKGGFIPTVDHRVPPDVTLDNYKYYVEKKRSLLIRNR